MRGFCRFGVLVKAVVSAPKYPAGTRLLFDQDNPPTGWTRDTAASLDDRLLRIVVGTRGEGGSWTLSGLSADPHSHNLNDVPSHTHVASAGSHTHSFQYGTGVDYTYPSYRNYANPAPFSFIATSYSITLSYQGVASPTTSLDSYSVSSNGLWRPLYRDMIIAEKD